VFENKTSCLAITNKLPWIASYKAAILSHTMTKYCLRTMTRRPKPHLCTQRKPITPASRRAIRYPNSSPSARSNLIKGPKAAIQVGDYASGIQTLQAEVGGCGVLLPSHVLAYPFTLQRLGPPSVLLLGRRGSPKCISLVLSWDKFAYSSWFWGEAGVGSLDRVPCFEAGFGGFSLVRRVGSVYNVHTRSFSAIV